MIFQLKEIFGDYLEYVMAAVMSRTPLVIIGSFSEKELYYLADAASPHRFVLFAPNITKDEAISVLKSELTEKSKRLILVFKDFIPSFISDLNNNKQKDGNIPVATSALSNSATHSIIQS